MSEWVMACMNQFGYLGIAGLILLETIFPPIPSELILAFGGFMTTTTQMSLFGVVISSTIGSLLGAVCLYGAGSCIPVHRLEKLFDSKLAHILRFKKADVQKAMTWFEKRGKYTVFFCRFVPVLRSLISIPAGIARMKLIPFLCFTIIGSLIWNLIISYTGALMGIHWETIVSLIGTYANAIVLLFIGCTITIWFMRRIHIND